MSLKQDNEALAEENLLKPSLDETKIVPTTNISLINDRRTSIRENETDALQEHTEVPELETPLQRRLRRKSHLVIFATTFIMSIGFSIILTGVWPYLKELDRNASKEFLGWAVAVNPLGQMIASPFLGWWGSRKGSNRFCFIITIAMFIVGSLLYAILPLFEHSAKYIMLLSRFIIGISSANLAVCRCYISASTKLKERTTALSIAAAAQSMGYILGPSLQTLLVYIHPINYVQRNDSLSNLTASEEGEDLLKTSQSENSLNVFNMYSLTGWLTAVLGFLNMFMFLPCVYKEFNIAESEERNRAFVAKDDATALRHHKTDYVALSVVLFGYFSILLVYVLLETLIVPMCLDLYAWTPEFTVKVVGIGLTIAGLLSFFMFILSGKLAKILNDRKVFIVGGLIPLTLSLLLFFPMAGDHPKIKYCPSENQENTPGISGLMSTNSSSEISLRVRRGLSSSNENDCDELGCPSSQEWCFFTPIIHIPQLIVASCLMTLGYPVGVGLTGAIFSKMMKVKEQGLWMGILTSSGSLSRFLGPIFVSYLYTAKGPLWTFAVLFVLFLGVLILNVIFYHRMAPLCSPSKSPT